MAGTIDPSALIVCPHCDALYRRPALRDRAAARCVRCGVLLLRHRGDSIDRCLALTLAGLILFVPANVFDFFSFGLHGRVQPSTIFGGAAALHDAGYSALGFLIAFTSVLAPLLNLLLLLYVCLPLRFGRMAPGTIPAYRFYGRLCSWGMLSVYLLGALVAIVKMGDYGDMVLGRGFYAFLALLLVAGAAQTSLEPEDVWRRVEAAR